MTLPNIDYKFTDSRLLEQAFTHKSYFNENADESPGHNERFEFLGDAVLDLSVSDLLMKKYPEAAEGELSKRRAGMVNEATLAQLALKLNFNDALLLGKGEVQTGGAAKPRLLASVFEAFIGAVYLDAGFQRTHEFITENIFPQLEEFQGSTYQEQDYKTRLQEISQELHHQAPVYKLIGQEGPDHEKTFFVSVRLNGKVTAEGRGRSKKQAEQEAARKALEKL